jgi:drug/metabolite transporter (DMT)-like permease
MKNSMKNRNRTKTLVVMSFAVLFGALGDILLSKGMKSIGSSAHFDAVSTVLAVITNMYVLAGVGALLLFLILYLISLSWEDMSYVLPLTGAIYVLVTIFAFFLLHEPVSALRLTGSLLVACGIVVVTRT